MLVCEKRDQARIIGSILNKIAGKKVVKQARSKIDTGWPIPWIGGTLKCPPKAREGLSKVCPQKRRKAKRLYVVGVDLENPNISGQALEGRKHLTSMSLAFNNANMAH